jgi:hypothetical protein
VIGVEPNINQSTATGGAAMIKFLALILLALAAALIYAPKFRFKPSIRASRRDDDVPMDMAKIERALTDISNRYRV